MSKRGFFQLCLFFLLLGIFSAFPVAACQITLGDFVWHDSNSNGIQDNGESGVGGVGVNLFLEGGSSPITTKITDSEGKYLFSWNQFGDYIVEFIAPTGYEFTVSGSGGDPGLDSDAILFSSSIARTNPIPIYSDGTYLDVGDAGLINQVPIPPALLLLGSGMLGVLGIRRFKK